MYVYVYVYVYLALKGITADNATGAAAMRFPSAHRPGLLTCGGKATRNAEVNVVFPMY